jgi:hypothetical protein
MIPLSSSPYPSQYIDWTIPAAGSELIAFQFTGLHQPVDLFKELIESNLGRNMGYNRRGLSPVVVLPEKCWNSTLCRPRKFPSISFPVHYSWMNKTLYIYRVFNVRCEKFHVIVWFILSKKCSKLINMCPIINQYKSASVLMYVIGYNWKCYRTYCLS